LSGDAWDKIVGGTPGTRIEPTPPARPPGRTYEPWGREFGDLDEGIRVRLKSGEGQFVKHAFIIGCTWLGERSFSILSTLGAMVIQGQHLSELERLVIARKIDFLQEFDAGKWEMPAPGAPVIEKIELLTTRAQTPPGQRR